MTFKVILYKMALTIESVYVDQANESYLSICSFGVVSVLCETVPAKFQVDGIGQKMFKATANTNFCDAVYCENKLLYSRVRW